MSENKPIIGRAEIIEITNSFLSVPAKIDTGAYRSSVHASNIHIEEDQSSPVLVFTLLEGHPNAKEGKTIRKRQFKTAQVQNSFGMKEERYVVLLKVRVGKTVYNTHFTLANREKNVYPVLLGRRLLRHFLVDSTKDSTDRIELKHTLFKALGMQYEDDDEDNEEVDR